MTQAELDERVVRSTMANWLAEWERYVDSLLPRAVAQTPEWQKAFDKALVEAKATRIKVKVRKTSAGWSVCLQSTHRGSSDYKS